jgi:excisionase family DNA binding protein
MIDQNAQAVNGALISFLQAFARLIAQEIWQQVGTQVVQRVEEPPTDHLARKLLNAREAADFLQVKLNRLYEISHWKGPDGLRCVRIGRQIRFRMEDIEAYLERQSRGGL